VTKRRIHAEPRRFWTKAEDRQFKALYPHQPTADIALDMGRTVKALYQRAKQFGLAKTAAYLASPEACRLRRDSSVGEPYRFRKGQQAWNKGKHYKPGGRAVLTQFKPGQRSARWPIEDYPIGALRINSDGQIDIKFREGLRAWHSLARWTWITERGPIPRAMVIRHRNGDQHDTRMENLELITRAEHLRRNWHDRYPLAIKQAVQLRGALQRQINKREGKHEQHDKRSS
jgi:hypothetical protein